MSYAPVAAPTFVQIEPVGQCNLRCQMCPISFRRDGPPNGPPAFMPFDTFTSLLDQFPACEELQLQGLGEPMMHPRFFDMVRHAAARGIRVSTNSNLTLVNSKRAERCVTSGLAMLHVSLDGATAATYERIRVRARFERVLANLHAVVSARETLASSTPGLRLVVVAMRQNLHEFPDLVRLAHRFGIGEVFVQHLCHEYGESDLPDQYLPMRDFVQRQTLVGEDPTRLERFFEETRAAARALGVEVRLPSTIPRPHAPQTAGPERCNWPWRGAYLDYRGRALPCCMVSTADRVQLGNMAEAGAKTVWNGPAYQSFRKELSSETPPEVCRSCSIYWGTF